jgi:hypothetical protein
MSIAKNLFQTFRCFLPLNVVERSGDLISLVRSKAQWMMPIFVLSLTASICIKGQLRLLIMFRRLHREKLSGTEPNIRSASRAISYLAASSSFARNDVWHCPLSTLYVRPGNKNLLLSFLKSVLVLLVQHVTNNRWSLKLYKTRLES